MYKTKEEVESWLNEMEIENYVINEDLTVDVNGNVNLRNEELIIDEYGGVNILSKRLKKIPIQFGIINGNFDCSFHHLTDLAGCPKEVKGNFSCGVNNLTDLKYCPKEIGSNFHCNINKLTSLKGCPEVINGSFYCNNNELVNFDYFPKEINSEYINISNNNIKEDELINFNSDIKNVKKIYSDFNESGDKEKFLEKIRFYKNIKKENKLLKEISANSNNIKLNKKL